MLFSSLSYLLFFPLVLAAYWLAPKSWRRPLLLVASYLFYMSWIPAYGALLLFLSVFNYGIGIAIDRFRTSAKPILLLGLVANLGILFFFKYANFLLDALRDFLQFGHNLIPLVNPTDIPNLNVILPLGISFFAFEFIHYITDVYKGDRPIRNPVDFGLFAAFFPSQIAGPIKRYQDFEAQLENLKPLNAESFQSGLSLILQGLFKKVALSDNISTLVNFGFGNANSLTTVDAWLATLAFALQIYFDFSGYTDMGRGSAMMLGFSLPDNFNLPYLATSLSDFWKRWHISLSSWLRDYLYIPLGGGRVSRWRKHLNLLITMLLGGLWHGASWHYVVWGGIHGLGLVANHEYNDLAKNHVWLQSFHKSTAGRIFSGLITFSMVLLAWVFFRASDVNQACMIVSRMVIPQGTFEASALINMLLSSPFPTALFVYIIYFAISHYHCKIPVISSITARLPIGLPTRIAVYVGAFFAALGFSPSYSSPFIYFQF